MMRHPDFEGALEIIVNEYRFEHRHLANEGDFRADFARHVARRLRECGIGLHAVGEPDGIIMTRDEELARDDELIRGLLAEIGN